MRHLPFKRLVFAVLGSDIPLRVQVARIAAAGAVTVLNLHRVDDRAGSLSAMKPALFRELAAWLSRHFTIVRFRDLATLVPSRKPPLVLSFDDGYKDFVEVVAPILHQLRLPANQNVVPRCVATAKPPMNVVMRDFIGDAPAALLRGISIPGITQPVDPDDRPGSAQRASAAIKNRPIDEQRAIYEDLQPIFAKFDDFTPTPMMTLDDIRSVASEFEIGMHSWEHATMACETNDYLAEDAARCRAWSMEQIGVEAEIYAFPNGSARPGHAEIVREAGFPCVLLVGEDFTRRATWLHRRFTMYGSTASETRFRATGSLRQPRAAIRSLQGEHAA